MSDFKIVSDANEINLDKNKWQVAQKFKGYSIGGFYTKEGKKASSDYGGHRYTIVDIRVRNFSGLERFGRGLLGIAAVICSLGLALFSESVRNLFISSEKGICFAKKIEEKKALEGNKTGNSSSVDLEKEEEEKEEDGSKVGNGSGLNPNLTNNNFYNLTNNNFDQLPSGEEEKEEDDSKVGNGVASGSSGLNLNLTNNNFDPPPSGKF